jgi:uncharacterized membrane protein HdeD (DUF308 family)
MKQKRSVPILIILVIIISVILYFIGFNIVAIGGLGIIVFFGIEALFKGITGVFKPARKRNLLKSILWIIIAPFFIWIGCTMLASGFYSPMVTFLNNPTNVISNPSGSIIGFTAMGIGLGVLFLILKNKQSGRKSYFLIFSGIIFAIVGCLTLYSNFSSTIQSSNDAIITYKTSSVGASWLIPQYELDINVNGETKDFNVSNQIFHIFNIGDNVTITYAGTNLKSITLSK